MGGAYEGDVPPIKICGAYERTDATNKLFMYSLFSSSVKRQSKVGQIIKFAISAGFDNLPHLTLSFDDSPRVVSMTGGTGPHLSFSGRGQIIKRQSKVGQIIKFSISGRFDNWCEAYATTCLSCISMHPNPCREASQ